MTYAGRKQLCGASAGGGGGPTGLRPSCGEAVSREGAATDDEAAKARPRGVWDRAAVAGDGCTGSLADEAREELDAVDCKDRLGGAVALAGV